MNTGTVAILDLTKEKQTGDFCVHLSTLRKENNKRVFQLTSAHSGEGCTTFAVNVARLLAAREKNSNVLLIDANFQNPQLFNCFELAPKPGFQQLLAKDFTDSDAINQVEPRNLYVMFTGTETRNPDCQLSVEQLTETFDGLRKRFDFILIDSVPIMSSHNAIAIALASDETFLVIQSGRSNIKVLQNAVSKFTDHNCTLNSAVLNRIHRPIPSWLYQWLY
ncbi:MAG: CpsD/CapB family tyrosine-protein kinase [Proteobacteria bacterium]|nr:CpsD/CapB family tyrosine-protein kinase [Pseudomonadota bacterium]